MELQDINVIFVLCLVGSARMVSGLCLIRNTTEPDDYWYQCFRSNDKSYLTDLRKAPLDLSKLSFINSEIRVIKNESFTRLGKKLEMLVFFLCGVEEIEDNALQGLGELNTLGFVGNKLKVIKTAWFRGLSSLKSITFQKNEIKHVEQDFFSTLPPLEAFDISFNQLTCLPMDSAGNFKTNEFNFRNNPLTNMCRVLVMDWMRDARIGKDRLIVLGDNDPLYDLVKICTAKISRPRLDEEYLNKCVQETTLDYLPDKANYTVAQACGFLRGKPSPFLDCTE